MGGVLSIEGLSIYVLVFARLGGMIFFNPLLSRRNIPSQVRMAIVLGGSLLLAPGVADTLVAPLTDFTFVWAFINELLIGFAAGVVFQFFYYLLFMAGDVMDLGFGLSMAKAFDPGTNIQMSVSGNLFQLMFVLYVLLTDGHLLLIRLVAASYDLVGVGGAQFGADLSGFVLTAFHTAFGLIVQLILPFLAATFVLEMSMGLLMKLIPQINVFSIHFQLKIGFGVLLLFLFSVPISSFMESYVNTVFVHMQEIFLHA